MGRGGLRYDRRLNSVIRPFSAALTLSVCLQTSVPRGIYVYFTRLKRFSGLILFIGGMNVRPSCSGLLRSTVTSSPMGTIRFKGLVLRSPSLKISIRTVFSLFTDRKLIRRTADYILSHLGAGTSSVTSLRAGILKLAVRRTPRVTSTVFRTGVLGGCSHSRVTSLYRSTKLCREMPQRQLLASYVF